MAQIEFTNSPEGYSLNTQFAGGGAAPGGGPDMSGMGNFFAEMARRKMRQAAADRQHAAERQNVGDRMDRKDWELRRELMRQQMKPEAKTVRTAGTRTFAHLAGLGQVEVAPGTQGVNSPQYGGTSIYRYSTGDSPEDDAAAAQRGFRPGLVGTDVGLTGWAEAAKDFSRDPGEFEQAEDMRRRRGGPERQTSDQAGWGLGYQPLGR